MSEEERKDCLVRQRLEKALITGDWTNTSNEDILIAKKIWLSLNKDNSDNVLASLAWYNHFDQSR